MGNFFVSSKQSQRQNELAQARAVMLFHFMLKNRLFKSKPGKERT